jgi:molybdopterin-guanine dinucleotide biosynthesis protein A
MHSGVILAGGRSTRFGEADKAVADLGGTPMIRRVANRIVPVIGELVINCRSDQTDAIRESMDGYGLPVSYAVDDVPDRGPVAGIRNGLAAAAGRYAFLVACDMPFVDSDLAAHLFDRAASHDGAVPRRESGWYETTQAVYRVEAMRGACESALQEDNPRILDPLEDLDYVAVPEAEFADLTSPETFENLNTRAEFEAAQDRFD